MAKKSARKSLKKGPAKKQVPIVPVLSLKIMVSSTVYGAETDLDIIKGVLEGYGYEVIMSKNGTVYVPSGFSAEQACLKAVEDCDLFLGIIFPRYGSGITHKEFKKAIQLNKPRWFISHHYVTFAREILKQYRYKGKGKYRNRKFVFKKTPILDSDKVIDMYDDAIQNNLPPQNRKSNWAHPFFNTPDIYPFLKEQFEDIEKRRFELQTISKKRK